MILVVSDDPAISALLQSQLTGDGLVVAGVPDAFAAIRLAARYCPAVLVLDAPQLARHARLVAALRAACGSELPVIAIRSAGHGVAADGEPLPEFARHAAPVPLQALAGTVRRELASGLAGSYLARERPARPTPARQSGSVPAYLTDTFSPGATPSAGQTANHPVSGGAGAD